MQEWNERRVNTWRGKLERSWFRRTRGQRIAASCVLAASGLAGFVALVCTAAWSGCYHSFDAGIWEFIQFRQDYIVLLAVFLFLWVLGLFLLLYPEKPDDSEEKTEPKD